MADQIIENSQPETFVLFAKTTDNKMHIGGLVYFTVDEADVAKNQLKNEADYIATTNNSSLVCWGVLSSLTGEIVRKYRPQNK